MCTGVGIFKDELRKCLKRVRFGLGVCDVLFYTAKAEEGGIRILRLLVFSVVEDNGTNILFYYILRYLAK